MWFEVSFDSADENQSVAIQMKATEQNFPMVLFIKHNRLKIPNGRRQTSWLFTNVTKALNWVFPVK